MSADKIKIRVKQATVGKWNPRREKHGDEGAPAGDLNISVLMKADEAAQLVHTSSRKLAEILWDSTGEPELMNVSKAIAIDVKATGTAKLGARGSKEVLEFHDAKLKKVSVEPQLGRNVLVHLQVAFDDTGHADYIRHMQVDEVGRFGFDGTIDSIEPGADDDQTEMDV